MPTRALRASILTLALGVSGGAAAHAITLPPDGGNQKASVAQWLGPVEVRVTYNSPKVTAPDGTDRRGKIFGTLVPYGMKKESYGTCGESCPWRAGANENTVFTVSHDVKVEGQALPAGSYGLHMVAGPEEWTVIFSKSHESWGSYFYDAKLDALRVKVKARKAPYTHWLTYDFVERQLDKATVVLRWDELEVPIAIAVDDVNGLYMAGLGEELKGAPGGTWDAWEAAARFALQNKRNDEALRWARYAVSGPFVGVANFRSLSTLADAQEASGQAEEARKTIKTALESPTATPIDLHQYGRRLLRQKKAKEALEVFELNARRNPNVWPVNVGLARGYAAVGRNKEALEAAKKALAQAPDDGNRTSLQGMVKSLEAGKPLD